MEMVPPVGGDLWPCWGLGTACFLQNEGEFSSRPL